MKNRTSCFAFFLALFAACFCSCDKPGTDPFAVAEGALVPAKYYSSVKALCIGIDRYRFSGGIGELDYAENDARMLADLLSKSYGYETELLLGAEATKGAIEKRMAAYQQSSGENDAVLVFFAGHGQTVEKDAYGRQGFLVPFDAEVDMANTTDIAQWREQSLAMDAVSSMLTECKARHVLLLLDCCFSGLAGKRSGIAVRPEYKELIERPCRMVITAGTDDQTALEAGGHGIFSAALGKHLANDWAVSATELFLNVRRDVANQTSGQMVPQLREFVVENGEFIFFPINLQTDIKVDLAKLGESAKKRGANSTKTEDGVAAFEALDYRFSKEAGKYELEWTQRFKRFTENASLGEPLAMVGLHYCYAKGLGTEADPTEALKWAKMAYDTGHPAGAHVLGRCYILGIGVEQNRIAADGLIKLGSDGDFPISHITRGRLLFDKAMTARAQNAADWQQQTKAALGLLRRAAEQGLASGHFHYGQLTANLAMQQIQVPGISSVLDDALKHVVTAADAGLPRAKYILYTVYVDEEGRTELAKQYLESAAEAGDIEAQYMMAAHHFYLPENQAGIPQIYPQDYAVAHSWAQLAAKQNQPQALVILANMYQAGKGVTPDYSKAFTYARRSAELNWSSGIYQLAVFYVQGIGVKEDMAQAQALFGRAGDMFYEGSGEAFFMCGLCREMLAAANKDAEVTHNTQACIQFMKADALGYKDKDGKLQSKLQKYKWARKDAFIYGISQKAVSDWAKDNEQKILAVNPDWARNPSN